MALGTQGSNGDGRCYFPELPKLNKVLGAIAEIGAFSPHDGAGWELKKLRWYRDALFEHFAPFKVGDLVVLHTAYEIPSDSGWRGREEMMHAGATGEVRAVDWTSRQLWHKDAEPGDGAFSISVRFDREWYVSNWGSGKTRTFEAPDDERHVFMFSNPERWWRKREPDEFAATLPGHEGAVA